MLFPGWSQAQRLYGTRVDQMAGSTQEKESEFGSMSGGGCGLVSQAHEFPLRRLFGADSDSRRFLDLAEGTMQCPATHSANAWPTERTQLFRRKVEEAIQNLCRVRGAAGNGPQQY